MLKSTPSAIRLRRAQRALIDHLESGVGKGFFDSCKNITGDTIVGQLVAALEKKDTEKAIELLTIDPSAFRPYIAAIEHAWEAGGNLAANTMPKLVKKDA